MSTSSYIRPLTLGERAQSAINHWTCARCRETATRIQWTTTGRLGYRLCDEHAAAVREGLRAAGLLAPAP